MIASVQLKKVMSLWTPGTPLAISWSRDAKYIVASSAYGATFTVWDEWGKTIRTVTGADGGHLRNSIALLAGGALVLSPLAERLSFMPTPRGMLEQPTLNLWNVTSGHVTASVTAESSLDDFTVSPDENVVVSAPFTGELLKVFSLPSLKLQFTTGQLKGPLKVAFFPTNRKIVVGCIDGSFSILNLNSSFVAGKANAFYKDFHDSRLGHADTNVSAQIDSIAVSPDSKDVAVAAGLITTSAVPNAQMPQLTPETQSGSTSVHDWISALPAVQIWSISPLRKILDFPSPATPPIQQISWDKTGSTLFFSDSQSKLWIWRPFTHERPSSIALDGTALSIAVSPDGRKLAVASRKSIDLYEIALN